MKQKMISALLVIALLINILPISFVQATENKASVTISTDKTSAKQGDEITYTVTMSSTVELTSGQIMIDIPTGLTYVENSKNFIVASFVAQGGGLIYEKDCVEHKEGDAPVSQLIITLADANPFNIKNGSATILTFKCRVNELETESYDVTINEEESEICGRY